MPKVKVLDRSGKELKELNAPDDVLSYSANEHLLYEAVVNYRANQRQGTASTKTRKQVSGGGKKPWRQKGTGRARAGSTRSPLWRKGGITFGPHLRSYYYKLPKKSKTNAIKFALSEKYKEGQITVMKDLTFKEPRTKDGVSFLESLGLDSVLIVDSHENKNLILSMRNIPGVKIVDYNQINVYDILNHKSLIFSQQSFDLLMEKLK
ncbi:MAG: 50S ribosomal protein L4 [Candidatus Aminicenantes bacterium]|nr:50S ribosomal protein L4 [Candidatus Aminicenantes bacterium]